MNDDEIEAVHAAELGERDDGNQAHDTPASDDRVF